MGAEKALVGGDATEVGILEVTEPAGNMGRVPTERKPPIPVESSFAVAGAEGDAGALDRVSVLATLPNKLAVGVLDWLAVGVLDKAPSVADEAIGLEDEGGTEAVAERVEGEPEPEQGQAKESAVMPTREAEGGFDCGEESSNSIHVGQSLADRLKQRKFFL